MLDAPAFQLFDENKGFLTQLLLQIHIPFLHAMIMKVPFSLSGQAFPALSIPL